MLKLIRRIYLKVTNQVDVELNFNSIDESVYVESTTVTIKKGNYEPLLRGDEILLSEVGPNISFFLVSEVKMYKDNSLRLYRVEVSGDLYEATRVS